MLENTKILYCSDRETYLGILKTSNVFSDLRVPNPVRNYINNIIITEQVISKRGVMKYLTICYQGEEITEEQILKEVPALRKAIIIVYTMNNYTTISIFNNNLTFLLKQTELLLNCIHKRNVTEAPKINISTDLDGVTGVQYICNDISAYIDIIQLTSISNQKGDIYLGITDLSDEFIVFLLMTCINASGRLKIHLLCDEMDVSIWKLRGIALLQQNNCNIDYSILDDIIDKSHLQLS